jgi:hypothetical protein
LVDIPQASFIQYYPFYTRLYTPSSPSFSSAEDGNDPDEHVDKVEFEGNALCDRVRGDCALFGQTSSVKLIDIFLKRLE